MKDTKCFNDDYKNNIAIVKQQPGDNFLDMFLKNCHKSKINSFIGSKKLYNKLISDDKHSKIKYENYIFVSPMWENEDFVYFDTNFYWWTIVELESFKNKDPLL